MRVRRGLSVIGVVAAMTAVSACNGGDQAKKSGDAESSASASASSSSAPSAASASPSTASIGHLDKAGLVQALTVGQIKAGSAHMAMRMSGATSLKAQGDVAYHGKSPQMRMTMTMAQLGNGPMELRFVDGIFYLQIPHVTPAGKFIRVDPRDKTNPLSKNFGSLSQQMNPLGSFAAMKAGVQKVRYVGHDTVDGTPTDHYVVTVDGAALTKAMKQPQVAALPKHLTYDMWVGPHSLLRRMQFRIQGLAIRMDLTRWGEPVHVQAPPTSQVVDPSRIAG
jgi:LppX_LprAFG lipoprotein